MEGKVIAVILVLGFVFMLTGFVLFWVNGVQMISEIEPRRRKVASFIPFVALLRSSYTPAGQRLHRRAVVWAGVAAFGGVLVIVARLVG